MASAWKIDRTTSRGTVRSTVQYRDPDTGEKVTDGTYTVKAAEKRVAELLVKLDDIDFTRPKLGKRPFKEYAELWFANRPTMASTKKIRSYLDSQLIPAFGNVRLIDIDRYLVQEWVDSLSDPEDPDATSYSPESIGSYYTTLSTIMKYAAIDRHIPVSRIGKGMVVLPPRGMDTRVFLTLAQLEKFLGIVAEQLPYWYPMIKLAAETGMRWGEVAGMTINNVDLEHGSVLVDHSLALNGHGDWQIGLPKGGRWRRLSIDDDTIEPLKQHLLAYPTQDHAFGDRAYPLAFTNPNGRPLDRNNFRRDVWKPLIDSIDWLDRGLRFHDLRHTHITILLSLGALVEDVSQRAGHASTKMTQDRYGHVMPGRDGRLLDTLAIAKAAQRGDRALRVVS